MRNIGQLTQLDPVISRNVNNDHKSIALTNYVPAVAVKHKELALFSYTGQTEYYGIIRYKN